ncbi:hypothetical protein P3342_005596 [Pyrenophora teres f. teres]|uniref:Protein kinase domain-containing protein n=2 Tax=Pyrenophora teres f. teres TaxID=97479 RepID=E3RE42_PYRTT|nr:hypothetical protein PTT_03641 [Pyrenophora teres f. teres 0-1]KAE8845926.1 hypothetical protein HRS9139_00493 [Pyrenophora teres f. teres]KAE8848064.1 hypothetical protein PTNB85_01907 [Pyrenophora teres f. teres]KAE8853773.1 hypothetical protein HRS9122_00765 [Pyrenophora teres f. teres]KAE8867989.1 hypothetical protein PTNB29_01900 [Pyrenophora teres f. teres]
MSKLPVPKAYVTANVQKPKARESQDPLFDLRDYLRFRDTYWHICKLGAGGDGTVNLWKHRRSGAFVAVKTPNQTKNPKPCPRLIKEAKNLERLGKHPQIIEMLTYSETFKPRGPAVFLEYAPLGDMLSYQEKLLMQQAKQKKPQQMPESTICKLLSDMGLALGFVHGKGFMHTDFKPENILVCPPDGWADNNEIPVIPVFKLTDFSRMATFPLPFDAPEYYCGTPEYAPPLSEQVSVRPSGDLWSLGCTIQTFALCMIPTQSKQAFIADRQKAGKTHPALLDERAWNQPQWRRILPTVYRPLNVTKLELVQDWDVPDSLGGRSHIPYSTYLNTWYTTLWNTDEKTRITAEALVENYVPTIASDIELAEAEQLAEASFKAAKMLREHATTRSFVLKRCDTREDSLTQGLGDQIARTL